MNDAKDGRLKRSEDETRENRGRRDRSATESRELSDDDRLEMFQSQFFQAALPDLPKIPGFHVCWLTTQNPRDPIMGRLRLGYELIRAEELPGYEAVSLKTGEYAGCIGVNEMLAAKLPERLYQQYMTEAHHAAPDREQEKLTDTARQIQRDLRAAGADAELGDGMVGLEETRPTPVFD